MDSAMSIENSQRDRADLTARIAAIAAAIVAALVMNVLPVITGTLTQYLPTTPSELGAFGSADLVGITGGSWLASRLLKILPLRLLAAAGTMLLLLANIASAWAPSINGLIVLRGLGGIGSGLSLGVCFYVFGLKHNERNLGAYLLGQTALGFLIILIIPILTKKFGWQSAFLALALVTAPIVVLTRWLPSDKVRSLPKSTVSRLPARISLPIWIAVGGTVAFFMGQGALWTFLERIGTVSGIAETEVVHSLAVCAVFGFLSSGVVLLLGSYISGIVPLAFSVLINLCGVAMATSPHGGVFAAAISIFNFSLPIFATCQFSAITRSDHTGRVAVHMSTASFGGFALGPYLGGLSVERFGYASLQWIDAVMIIVAAATLLPLMLVKRSHA
jgi:MFS transporter, DHA1 family, inner membrane transport protein